MPMYHWSSKYLANYGSGYIIVCADDVEAARSIARTGFEAHVRQDYDYLFSNGQPYDEDAAERIEEYRAKFEKDIAVDPYVVSSGYMFIDGSE